MAAVAAVVIVAAPSAHAQLAGTWNFISTSGVGGTSQGGTNAIVANTTNTYAVRLDVPRSENIVLFSSFKLAGAGTSAIEFILSPGTESGYSTNTAFVHKWNIPANGTTGVAAMTNIYVQGIPYLWVISQGHNNANAVTNMSFGYGFKR